MTERDRRAALIELGFLEARNHLLELAAFIDRVDGCGDFRVAALLECSKLLAGEGPERVKRIQMLLSDPRSTPLQASDKQPARGAYRRI